MRSGITRPWAGIVNATGWRSGILWQRSAWFRLAGIRLFGVRGAKL